jgi:hypothetical protein
MTSVLANNGPFQMAGARGILERAGGALQITNRPWPNKRRKQLREGRGNLDNRTGQNH